MDAPPELRHNSPPVFKREPAHPSLNLLIRNARILTLACGSTPRRGKEMHDLAVIPQGDVLVTDGLIAAVGPKVEAPEGSEVIDANGRVRVLLDIMGGKVSALIDRSALEAA